MSAPSTSHTNNDNSTPTFTLHLPGNNNNNFFGISDFSTPYGSATNFNASNGSTLQEDANTPKNFNTSVYSSTLKSNSSTKIGKISKNAIPLIGDSVEDDVHVGVSCLRALMNNKFGLNMVFNNQQAIYCIVRSILHHSLRY